jgi:hypothetical protein
MATPSCPWCDNMEVGVKIGNFTRKSHTVITLAQSMEITLMAAADLATNKLFGISRIQQYLE